MLERLQPTGSAQSQRCQLSDDDVFVTTSLGFKAWCNIYLISQGGNMYVCPFM